MKIAFRVSVGDGVGGDPDGAAPNGGFDDSQPRAPRTALPAEPGRGLSQRDQLPRIPSRRPERCSPGRGAAACLRGRRKRSPRKSGDETGPENAALSAPPGRLVVRPTPAKPRKLGRKPALVSSLSRLAGLLGGGGSPERTGLVPSMRLLPLVGCPENSREFVGVGSPRGTLA